MKQLAFTLPVIILLLLTASAETTDAQSRHLTHQNMGLGGGGTAYVDTYHANFVNPANLMLENHRRPPVSIGVAGGLYTQAGGNLMNISIYNEYLTTNRVIEGEVAEGMLDKWFGVPSAGIRSVSAEVGFIPVAVSYRSENAAYSIASRARVLASSSYSRGFADLFFRGLNSDVFADGGDVSTNQEFVAFHEVSVGYSRTVMEWDDFYGIGRNARLYVGAAPKILFAQAYSRVNLGSVLTIHEATETEGSFINHNFNYSIDAVGELSNQLSNYQRQRDIGNNPPIEDFVEINSSDFSSVKGTSLGLDLGVTLVMDIDHLDYFDFGMFRGDKKLILGASLTDFGALNFKRDARTVSAADDFTWRGFTYDRELIASEFDGDTNKYFESVLKDSIGTDIYANISTEDKSGFRVGLPTMMNFGSHLLLGRFGLMLDVGKGFVERGNNSNRMHMTIGAEYRFFDFLPLRTGVRMGGYSSRSYHIGTGLEFRNFEFSVAIASTNSSEKNGGSLGFAWSGLAVHF